MPRGSERLTNARKEEIISACASLYETRSFKDITLNEISELTSFSRPSIYNYFQTKEEIFLALFQKEYELWTEELNAIAESYDALAGEELAQKLAHSLEKRERLLKLLSMNLYDMEANSRLERLAEFKVAYGGSIKAVVQCLEKLCPSMTPKDRQDFIYSFFPFICGIYPYAFATEKQIKAMEAAGMKYTQMSVYEIAYTCAKKLLKK